MSAVKIKATVKEVSKGGTILSLELDSPYYSQLSEGDKVYLKLNSANGHDIEFHEGSVKPKEEPKVEELQEEVKEPESEVPSDEFEPE